jgi:hypothetical protein
MSANQNAQQNYGVMNMPLNGKKSSRDEVHNGYDKKYKYSIFLNSDGVIEDFIHWCEKNCEGRWGWWYETDPIWTTHWDSSKNKAYMSFGRQKEATRFWFENCKEIYDSNY